MPRVSGLARGRAALLSCGGLLECAFSHQAPALHASLACLSRPSCIAAAPALCRCFNSPKNAGVFVVLPQLLRRFPHLEEQLPSDWLAAQRAAGALGEWMVHVGAGGKATIITRQQVGRGTEGEGVKACLASG